MKYALLLLLFITVVVILAFWLPAPARPEFKIADARLHIRELRVSYGKDHYSEGSRFTTFIKGELSHVGPHQFGYRGFPIPTLGSATSTNSLALSFGYSWDAPSTNFEAEMADSLGHPQQLRRMGLSTVSKSGVAQSAGTMMWIVDGPLPKPGKYEFRVKLGTNGPVLANSQMTLNFKP